MIIRHLIIILLFTLAANTAFSQIEVQGHRGWRGIYPENSNEGFIRALEIGVDVLELDVVMSKDGHPVVSHEPWMNRTICRGADNRKISRCKKVNLYNLTLEEIQSYDCGKWGHPDFPQQRLRSSVKPSLAQALEATETWLDEHPGLLAGYNIEIKREKGWDNRYCPPLETYCDAVVRVIRDAGIAERCVLQSFDPEVLEYLHRFAPDIPLALLTSKGKISENMSNLSFTPAIYSPNFRLLDEAEMKVIRRLGVIVVPWTVNDEKHIYDMIQMGVDGIISDYPERVLGQLNRL
jgi:glycerophosphoryl diester phosphodiesterase